MIRSGTGVIKVLLYIASQYMMVQSGMMPDHGGVGLVWKCRNWNQVDQ